MGRPSGSFERKPGARNRSGCAGVWFVQARERWHVQIQLHRKRYHVGTFKTFAEAVAARRKAEEELQ
jgi:hypothetical protein